MSEGAMRTVNRQGHEIQTPDDWHRLAPPAAEHHWRDGYSAKTLAHLWLEGDATLAIRSLLASHDDLREFEIEKAVAEAKTGFDRFPGPRNHDVLLTGTARGGRTVVGIEAKVNETFGQTVAKYASAAYAKRASGEGTNAPERLAFLTQALAGTEPDDERLEP